MDLRAIERLAPPMVTSMMMFVPFSAQWLFHKIEPGPLSTGDAYTLNTFVLISILCYWRTCFTDPGRIPRDWNEQSIAEHKDSATSDQASKQRWCRKCEASKPPRSHHCKTCKRCVVKMDHHCRFTANCVSHVTLPHFLRLLIFSVISMIYIEYFLYVRCAVLWQKRHLPSYLGPSAPQLVHLFFLVASNSFLSFVLSILLGRSLWSAALNITTIEGWEIERHEALLRRSRALGGYLIAPGGNKIYIQRQEFPWDIGIWPNLCQAFGSRNPFVWLWPLASTPIVESGLSFEHNGIEDPSKPWPPPDPDRAYRIARPLLASEARFSKPMNLEEFRQRQLADFARYTDVAGDYVVRRKPFHERLEAFPEFRSSHADEDHDESIESGVEDSPPQSSAALKIDSRINGGGEETWRNSEGERLEDFGVDEIADFYDESDTVPLAEFYSRHRGLD